MFPIHYGSTLNSNLTLNLSPQMVLCDASLYALGMEPASYTCECHLWETQMPN